MEIFLIYLLVLYMVFMKQLYLHRMTHNKKYKKELTIKIEKYINKFMGV